MAGMSRVGLSPAEMARAGTMSEAKRKRYMNKGGLVKRKYGGNTSRMNRLEELGRVDAEKKKAYTKKGKRNLKAEKKRIVKELNGNDFVASLYKSLKA
jgi:hypothetical protein